MFQTPEIILWVLWILWTHLSKFTFSAQNILKQYFRDTASIGVEEMMEEVKNHPDSPPGIRNDSLIFLKWFAEDMEEKDYLRPFKESWFLPVYGVIWVEEDNRFIQDSSRLLSRVLKVPLISLNDMQKIRKRRTISRLENHQWEAKVWNIWSVLKNKVSLSYWKTFLDEFGLRW